jgi:enterochelin esterase-like enzyme
MKCFPLIALALFAAAARADDSRALSPEVDGEFTIGPDYTRAPELTVKEGVPKGSIHELTMKSEDSKLYPGIRGPYTRGVHVYVPSQYEADTAAPFIIVQDGKGQLRRLPPILDNLIAERRIPPIIAILVDNGGGDGQGSERGLEYDTVSGKYAEFIEQEVLPLVEKECNVKLTKDPEGRATMGGSSGAAAAFTMAWFHPELYHRVISYSGTFVNQQSPLNPDSPHGAWEYHEHLIPAAEVKPIRVWLHVSENDNGARRDEASLHNWVLANQRMVAALKEKGYHYQYVFAKNAGHTDAKVYDQTLPEALEWVWRGYAGK